MTIDVLAGLVAGSPAVPLDRNLPVVAGIRRLVEWDPAFARSKEGVRHLQEMLTLRGIVPQGTFQYTGAFGPKTRSAMNELQKTFGLPQTDALDERTWRELNRPVVEACALPSVRTGSRAAVVEAARQHARARAQEIPQNRGFWVRLYMAGNEGRAWPWCAGFASFVWIQAAAALSAEAVVKARRYRTFSCDVIANRGKQDGTFIEGAEVAAGRAAVMPGDLFLVQRTSSDWTHVGVVVGVRDGDTIVTVEGNTNNAGSREGLYVLERRRRIPTTRNSGLDFIRCPF